jgi:hypothetical protein
MIPIEYDKPSEQVSKGMGTSSNLNGYCMGTTINPYIQIYQPLDSILKTLDNNFF